MIDNKKSLFISLAKNHLDAISVLYNWYDNVMYDKDAFFEKRKIEKRLKRCIKSAESIQKKLKSMYSLSDDEILRTWWAVPIQYVTQFALNSLPVRDISDSHHCEYDWKTYGDGERISLCVIEEGNISKFDTVTTQKKEIDSDFSEMERESMMEDYKARESELRARDEFRNYGKRIHSLDTGKDYDSISDYHNSFEYSALTAADRIRYENSLSSERNISSLVSKSDSRYYSVEYGIGTIYMRSAGCVGGIEWNACKLLHKKNEIPQSVLERYKKTNSGILIGSYIHNSNDIEKVNMELFGDSLFQPAVSSAMALQIAAMMACFANKLY